MTQAQKLKNNIYGYLLAGCVLAASLGNPLKAGGIPALSAEKKEVSSLGYSPSVRDSLKTSGNPVVDISNIAGVHRTQHGITSNDLTIENPDNLYAIQRIFDNLVENTARTTPAGQKIVYVIGENHMVPAQKLAQVCLNTSITRVHGVSSHVFCYEQEYNLLEKIAQEGLELTLPDHVRGRLHEYDPNGDLVLQGLREFTSSSNAPGAQQYVVSHALNSGVFFMLTDAGRVAGNFIAPTDLVARDVAMQMYGVDITKESLYISRSYDPSESDGRGLSVRNGVMVNRALGFSERHKTDVIVQQCGKAHVFGNKEDDEIAPNSISALFAAQNCRVVPIFFDETRTKSTAENDVPDVAWAQFPDAVILRGVSDKHFAEVKDPDTGVVYSNLKEENLYIGKISYDWEQVAPPPEIFGGKPGMFRRPKFDILEYQEKVASLIKVAALTPK